MKKKPGFTVLGLITSTHYDFSVVHVSRALEGKIEEWI